MKKIISILVFCFLTGAMFGQSTFPRFIKIGNDTLSTLANIRAAGGTFNADTSYFSKIIINAKTDSYTLQLTDASHLITMNKATANNLTIPAHGTVNFPVGTHINISCIGAGKTTVVAAGGVTIISRASYLNITVLGDATIVKLATDTWKLIGSLE